jgi:outer membrane protein
MSNQANQGFFRFVKTRYLLNSDRQTNIKRSLSLKILLILVAGFTPNLVLTTSVLSQVKIQNTVNAKPQMRERDRSKTVVLKLPDLVQLVVQNNRELKNNSLNRIVAKQELEEAESKFSPTITPSFSMSADRSLGSSSSFDSIEVEELTPATNSEVEQSTVEDSSGFDDFDDTNFSRSLQIGANLLTPLGTDISLTTDPLADFDVLGLQIRQPLMRGAGTKVNRVSVQSARLNNTSQMLERKQSLVDKIVEAIKAYRTLIVAQESVKI